MHGEETVEQNLRARLKGLARFVPVFTASDFKFGTWHQDPPEASECFIMPSCSISDAAKEFVQAAYKLGWVKGAEFQWSGWKDTPEGKELIGDNDRVSAATPDQLAKLIIVYIRGDRFSEGLLNFAFEAGQLTAIVRRAEALLQAPLDKDV